MRTFRENWTPREMILTKLRKSIVEVKMFPNDIRLWS